MRGEHQRPPPRQQMHVERLDGQPLQVDDLGGARRAPVGEHLGNVPGQLDRQPQRAVRDVAVEALVDRVAGGAAERRRSETGWSPSVTSAPCAASAAHSARSYGGVNAEGSTTWTRKKRHDTAQVLGVEVSFCVVNTEQRELLVRGLDAIGRECADLGVPTEVLVLDNASTDGSAGAARRHPATTEVIVNEHRRGKGENDTALLRRARGRFCLLLNEDSELLPGATAALRNALLADPGAAAAGALLRRPDGAPQASAWRFPTPLTAIVGALFLHKLWTVQSRGEQTKTVDWAQSAALLVRREAAAQIDYFDPAFFVYSDEVDFCKRLRLAGWRTLWVPAAQAIHHEQLSTGSVPERRIVELSRNRDRYMHKHHSAAAAGVVRWLTAWTYALRAVAAIVVPGHDPRRYWRHVTATLHPERGEGLREAAYELNKGGRRL